MSNATRRRWALGMLLPALALSMSILTGAAGAQEVPELPVPDPELPAPPPGPGAPDLPEVPEPPDAPEPPETPDLEPPDPGTPEPPDGDLPDVPEEPEVPHVPDVDVPGLGALTIPPEVPEEICDAATLPPELCPTGSTGSTDDTTAGTIPGSDATTQVLGAGVAAAGGPMLPRTGPLLPLGVLGALLLAAGAALVRRSLTTP